MAHWMVYAKPDQSPIAPIVTTPRRWLNIYGRVDPADWLKVVRCFAGHLQMKSGLSEVRLNLYNAHIYSDHYARNFGVHLIGSSSMKSGRTC